MKKLLFSLTALGFFFGNPLQAQNTIITEQQGVDNSFVLESIEGSSGNSLIITQLGQRNSVDALLIQQINLLYQATQVGNDNVAELEAIWGGDNQVSIEQIGNQNFAYQLTLEYNNTLAATQLGQLNSLRMEGLGVSQLAVWQAGYENQARVFNTFGANNSNLWQLGNYNSYFISTNTSETNSIGMQLGNSNTAEKLMDSKGLFASYQLGNGNSVYMFGQGNVGDLIAHQIGDDNQASLGGGIGFVNLYSYQQGNGNSASLSAGNKGADLSLIQLGNENIADLNAQNGSSEMNVIGTVYQEGHNNEASFLSDGNDSRFGITQIGQSNVAEIYQILYVDEAISEAFIEQFGNENYARIEQDGFHQTYIQQNGNNNSTVIIGQ